jgi:hypothetical protein
MDERDGGLAERQRQDQEKADDVRKRQERLGHVSTESEESEEEDEKPKPKRRSTSK